MGYREIPKDRVLIFPPTPGFKGWETFFTEESITHPAKMNLELLRWIIETYTEPGEVILDPMAGTGSTIILASILGRRGIAVEYEPKFCEMIRANILLAERQAILTAKGRMTCIQGDARELSKLFSEADAVVTSPPYEGSYLGGGDQDARKKRLIESGYDVKDFFGGKARGATLKHYNEVDAVITSPPYEGIALQDYGSSNEALLDFEREVRKSFKTKGYYEHDGKRYTEREWRKVNKGELKPRGMPEIWKKILEQRKGSSYSDIAKVDAVVTSPPYEASEVGKGIRPHRWEKIKDLEGFKGRREWREGTPVHYSEDSENIGNLKGETYLESMLQVYRECHKVLKSNGGKLIVVVKNFIRNKAVVRLDLDTVKLCEAAGFTLIDRWYFKLPTRSFWRILYHKKYPGAPEVEFEDVLVFDGVKNESQTRSDEEPGEEEFI